MSTCPHCGASSGRGNFCPACGNRTIGKARGGPSPIEVGFAALLAWPLGVVGLWFLIGGAGTMLLGIGYGVLGVVLGGGMIGLAWHLVAGARRRMDEATVRFGEGQEAKL